MFLRDGWIDLYKTLGYEMFAHQKLHPGFISSFGVSQSLSKGGGVKSVWGLTQNPIGKIVESNWNIYNLKTHRDKYIEFSETHIDC